MSGRPSIITAAHLALLAVIYIRQSSLRQLIQNTGSTAVQRALAAVPRAWGWVERRILVIDGDLGRSASRPGKRQGFRQLIELICAGKVGCVFLEDAARMSRNMREACEFIDAVMEHNVPVYYNGRLFSADEEALGELLGLHAEVMVAVHEQKARTLRLKRGKAAKVQAGNAVSPPPIGYITEVQGKWRLDPDEAVRLVIRMIFVLYLELRSARKVALELVRRGLKLPRRRRGLVVWERPTGLGLVRILNNPNYTPDYFYRRTQRRTTPGEEGLRTILRPEKDWLVFRDHHEGYVTREEFAAIQAILKRNRFRDLGPTRGGRALLAHLLVCGRCDRPIKTPYQRRMKQEYRPAYVCQYVDPRGMAYGMQRCLWLPTEGVDEVVVSHVLQVFTGPSVADMMAVLKEAADMERDTETARRSQLQAAEAAVRDIERRYLAVDPTNDLVKIDLERLYQEAIRRRDELQGHKPAVMPSTLPSRDIEKLIELVGGVREIWDAPTTTNKDRQEILRVVIARIAIAEITSERLALDIVWKGGLVERVEVVRSPGIGRLLRELRGRGTTDTQISCQLAERGIVGRAGGPVTRSVISSRVSRLGLQHRVAWRDGLARIRELVLNRMPPADMVTELNRNGPPHWRGEWTVRGVRDAIRRLRKDGPTHGVPALPPDARSLHVGRTPNDAVDRLVSLRHAGMQWRAVAEEMNRLGLRPAKADAFTQMRCICLYAAWRKKGMTLKHRDVSTRRPARPGAARRDAPPDGGEWGTRMSVDAELVASQVATCSAAGGARGETDQDKEKIQ